MKYFNCGERREENEMSNVCGLCVHRGKSKDGWPPICEAYPEGLPEEFLSGDTNVERLSQCAPGFCFEPAVRIRSPGTKAAVIKSVDEIF